MIVLSLLVTRSFSSRRVTGTAGCVLNEGGRLDLRPSTAADCNKPADISAFDPADSDVSSELLQLHDYF